MKLNAGMQMMRFLLKLNIYQAQPETERNRLGQKRETLGYALQYLVGMIDAVVCLFCNDAKTRGIKNTHLVQIFCAHNQNGTFYSI